MLALYLVSTMTALQLWLSGGAAGVAGAPVVVADAAEQADARRATEQASARVASAEGNLAAVAREKREVAQRYAKELAEIDRLKKRKASWRRDRMLREEMARSLETSKQLTAIDRRLAGLRTALEQGRAQLLAAVERELRAGPPAARAQELRRLRSEVKRALRPPSRRIVLPDITIDPLADPEELEYQAAAILQGERELAEELTLLDRQASRYQRMAELRQKHRRAEQLDEVDDDRPRRSTGRVGEATRGDSAADPSPGGAGGGAGAPPEDDGGLGVPPDSGPDNFGGDTAVVLADVVDAGTLDALRQAERSSDPAVKARAAERARQQVAARKHKLEQARKRIEQRARRLRQ